MIKRDIAVTIQNLVQFYNVKNGIDELIKQKYSIDIYVPMNTNDSEIGKMFDETFDELKNMGYSPLRKIDDCITYKILLEPYPMDIYYNFNYKYRIKYKYAPISAKPNLTLNPENNILYDAILCYGNYEANYLRVYSNPRIIGNLKYIDFNRKINDNDNKKVLLYLPTYGDTCSIDLILEEFNILKKDYYIITKFHHGTSYLKNEAYRIEKLKEISDEYYDHKTPLIDLLKKTHIVLSDNSGSIFESILAGVPVAVFTEDSNKNKIENFSTSQYKFISKGYIPCTNIPTEIPSILKEATSPEIINKQIELKNILFYNSSNPINDFVTVIKEYLFDNIDVEYKKMHDVLVKDYQNKLELIKNQNIEILNCNEINIDKERKIEELNVINSKLMDEIKKQNIIIKYYENGKLYKLSSKIYKTYHKFIKRND